MGMYGELVNALAHTVSLPSYIWLWAANPVPGSAYVNVVFAASCLLSWISWYRNSCTVTVISVITTSIASASINFYQWPHTDEDLLIPQFFWYFLIMSADVSLPFVCKMALAVHGVIFYSFIAEYRPEPAPPNVYSILLAVATVFVFIHHYLEYRPSSGYKQDLLNAKGATLVLEISFALHIIVEASKMVQTPGYATEGVYSIIKAGFFSAVGLAAAGGFQNETKLKESLELLVKERTREIMQAHEKLRMVDHALQASETAIVITDSQQTIVWLNSAFETLAGVGKFREMSKVQMSLFQALQISNRDIEDRLSMCFDTEGPNETEIVLAQKHFRVEVSPFPASSCNKEKVQRGTESSRFLVVLRDITQQRARERAEKAAQQEAMLKQAMSDSMETLTHELRTPLQGVIGLTALLMPDEKKVVSAEETKKIVSMVMASSRLLLTLINNILDVRKCDARMMNEFKLSAVSLNSSMLDATNFCRPIAAVSDVKLDLRLDPRHEVLKVQSNPIRFQQVIINLVSNAIKYTNTGTTVRLRTDVVALDDVCNAIDNALASGGRRPLKNPHGGDGQQVAVVSVADSGKGVTKDQAINLFARYKQLENKNTANAIGNNSVGQPTGTGLGLNLCLKFVERMHGAIWVSDGINGGCCFSFCLPLVAPSPLAINKSEPVVALRRSYTDPPKQKKNKVGLERGSLATEYRVLVVDDTMINLKVFDHMLKRIGMRNVKLVNSGFIALDFLEKEQFDLVITDIQMPDMSGTELSDAIRSSPRIVPKPMVVGLTAEVSESLDQRCSASGMAQVLHKPISAAQMTEFFETLVLKPTTTTDKPKTCGLEFCGGRNNYCGPPSNENNNEQVNQMFVNKRLASYDYLPKEDMHSRHCTEAV